jgi:alkanesulfonate monooxygenase SsuD/methylene tetrahydromethanopterin reductase-like flavin-dependent oxidoreductase (luciferase family)
MRFGLCYIPDYHAELSGSYQDWYEGMLREVVAAERLGFSSAWFAEHRIPDFAFGSPAMFIAAAARETSTIRLGSSICLLPLNDPVRIAEDYAMADVLSGGRLDFGVGRGLYKYDYDMARVDMGESKDRFDEALDLVLAAWSEESFSFAGKYTTLDAHTVTPRTVQRPHPPVWVAAVRTEETYRWAGERGFHLLVAPFFFTDPAEQLALVDVYRSALAAAGHDPASRQIGAVYHLYCGADADDVAAIADPALGRYRAFTTAADLSRDAYRDPVAYRDWKGFFENRQTITLDQMKATRAVIGTVAECVERIGGILERYPLTTLTFEVNFGALPHPKVIESLERFGAEVLPTFRSGA